MKADLNITFYKEEKFKETPIGKIPEDWEIVKMKGQVNIETGKRAKGGALDSGYVASIGGEHLDDEGNILWDNMKFIPEDFYNSLKQGKVKLGDILLVKDGATTGKVAIFKNLLYEKAAVNEHVFIIRSKVDKVINEFLFYFLFSKFGQIQIRTRFHGMIGGITRKDIETILIPLFPLPEQKAIADILSTVDEAIQKTNEIIEKTERLKKGLMQELLTKGIGHKEYKQTPIGTIPKAWQVIRIGDVTLQVIDSPHKIPKKANFGVPFVSVNYMLKFPDYSFLIDETIKEIEYISDENSQEFLKRFNPEKGDILYSKWGTPGIAKLINTERRFIGSCSVALIKTKKEVIDSLYLVYALNSQNVQQQIIPYSKTSTRTEIHIGHIKRIIIPLPPLEEQKKIAEVLSTVDKRLEVERKRKEKLERIKKALMNLLLTGKIRIKVN